MKGNQDVELGAFPRLIVLTEKRSLAFDERIWSWVKTSFVSALQHAVPQFAEFAIQEMAASQEWQNGVTTLHDFAAETL